MSEFIGKSISCCGVPVEDCKAGGCRSSSTSCSTAVLLGEVMMECSGTDLTLAGFAWPKFNFCISDSALCGVEAGACLCVVTPLSLRAFLLTSLQFPQYLIYQTQNWGQHLCSERKATATCLRVLQPGMLLAQVFPERMYGNGEGLQSWSRSRSPPRRSPSQPRWGSQEERCVSKDVGGRQGAARRKPKLPGLNNG